MSNNIFYDGCEFFERVIRIQYPCKWEESPAPGEAVVTVDFDRPVRFYAPMGKIDGLKSAVEVDISADCGDYYLVSHCPANQRILRASSGCLTQCSRTGRISPACPAGVSHEAV